MVAAIGLCFVYGKLGGDEKFVKSHPNLKQFLHHLHHWMFGLIIIAFAFGFAFTNFDIICIPLGGFGLGLFLDDGLFHSFENYFQRKVCE